MRNILSLVAFLSAGTVLSLTGCMVESEPEPGPAPAPRPEPLPLASSFWVESTLSFEYGGPGSELPESDSFVLRLDGAADANVAAIFTSGEDSTSSTFTRAGSSISLRDSVELPIIARPGTTDARLIMESIELTVLDRNGDGSADALEGSGSGTYSFLVGETEFSESFTAEMSGELE